MSEQFNHTCSICGEKYHFCKDCSDASNFTPWRTIVDSIEHYKIFIIINDYTNKNIDKAEAKKQLSERDLTGLDTFVNEIKLVIEDILKYEDSEKSIISNTIKKK